MSRAARPDWRPGECRCAGGFTLIEVVLAISIAVGILVVVLYFYQQAANLRAQAIEQTEKVSAIRLLMDRITGELRSAALTAAAAGQFEGTSNSIQFVKTDVPVLVPYSGGALGRAPFPVTDLKLVRYQLESGTVTNVIGLLRSEEPFVLQAELASNASFDTTNTVTLASQSPVVEQIQYVQFRYWSGTNWLDTWSSGILPESVEVSFGAEPNTNAAPDAVSYDGELFRRIIALPGRGLANANPVISDAKSEAIESIGEAP